MTYVLGPDFLLNTTENQLNILLINNAMIIPY